MTMTKKQADLDWADHIGSSDLPADEMTFTDASNYGLDGYQFDGTMDEGVESQARLPSVRGLSKLPDGFVAEPDGSMVPDEKMTEDKWGFDLSTMLSEDEGALPLSEEIQKTAGVTDLSWLDPTQKQDPSRLPKGLHPEVENANSSIPELVDAWGAGKQTTGLDLVPNIRDREVVQYEEALSEGPRSGLPGNKTAEDLRETLFRAMRRSTFGHPISEIKSEVAQTLGASAPRAKKAMARIEAEHGLAGTVFVRAAAFPGIRNGKWVKELRRAAKTARYVVTDDAAVADKLKLRAVDDVPWKAALKHYRPLLSAAGYRVASGGNPQAVLRAAFLAGPEAATVRLVPKPVDVRPADRVSTAEARQAFLDMSVEERQVIDQTEKQAVAQRRKALVRIAKWVQAGLLDQDDALKLHASKASPYVLLKTGAELISASGGTAYEGAGTLQIPHVAKVSRKAAWAGLRAAENSADEEQNALEAHRLKQFHVHVAKMVRGGLMTRKEADKLVSLSRPLAEMYRMASAVAAQREKSAGTQVDDVSGVAYKGTVYKTAAPRRKAVRDFGDEDKTAIRLAGEAGVHPDDIPQVLRWVQGQRKAGVSVKKMASRLKAKFGPKTVEGKAYEGAVFGQAPSQRVAAEDFSPEKKRLFATAKKAGIPARNLERVIKFARQQMSEGLVGDDLDAMLQAKFAGPVREAAEGLLQALRADHEGLSGHLYVDAEAYMSPTGTTGCDEGALKHRANGLKFVMAAERCGGCIHAAHDRCKMYRKTLATEAPVKNPKSYQRKMIAASKAGDGEVTASYFSASEFDLNDPMDGIELDDTTSTEKLGEILFGEMHT